MGNRHGYEVSNFGHVRREGSTKNLCETSITNSGYIQVQLGRKKFHYIHRLVARAFIGPVPDGHEVNHKDGNKKNNESKNLEYVTESGNAKHAHDMGLTPPPPVGVGSKNGRAKLSNEDVAYIRKVMTERLPEGKKYRGTIASDLAAKFGVSRATIYDIKTRTWGHLQ